MAHRQVGPGLLGWGRGCRGLPSDLGAMPWHPQTPPAGQNPRSWSPKPLLGLCTEEVVQDLPPEGWPAHPHPHGDSEIQL